MKNIKELVGARLKELRKSRGFSQADIAEKVNLDSKHISRLETGKTFPYPETLESLAKALDVPVKEFFEFEHLEEQKVSVKTIQDLLEGAGAEKLRLIFKVVKAIVE